MHCEVMDATADLERKSGRIRPDDFAVPVHPATPYVAARDNESSLLPLVPMLPLSLLDGSTAEAGVTASMQVARLMVWHLSQFCLASRLHHILLNGPLLI